MNSNTTWEASVLGYSSTSRHMDSSTHPAPAQRVDMAALTSTRIGATRREKDQKVSEQQHGHSSGCRGHKDLWKPLPCAGSREPTWPSKGRVGLAGSTSRDSSRASCPDPCSLNPSAVRGWRAISTSRKHCQKKPRQCCYAGAIMSETQKGIATCKRAGAGSDSPGAPTHGSSPPRDGHAAPAVAPCAQHRPG